MTATTGRAGRREWIGLAVLLLPTLVLAMDMGVLFFAVPYISTTLAPSGTQQLWIMDMYSFLLAGLLITMGALGDRIGRRRLLMIGATGFIGASLLAAWSHDANQLIAARALLGTAGATVMPSTLALIRTMFHDPKQRQAALGAWGGVLTAGATLGPVAGGLLLDRFWWGSAFLPAVPVMALVLLTAPALLPEYRSTARTGRFDLLGAALSLAAILPLVYGIKTLAVDGWSPQPALALLAGLLLAAAFVWRQRTAAAPLLDLSLFRIRTFSGAISVNTIAMFAMMGFSLFTSQYLQLVKGMSPLTASLWSLVPSVGVGAAVGTSSALAGKVRPAVLMGGGFLIGAAGFAMMTQVGPHSPLALILTAAGVLAAGTVGTMTMTAEMVVSAAPVEQAGAASATSETAVELGSSLGIALLGAAGAAVYRHQLDGALPAGLQGEAARTAQDTLGGAVTVAAHLPGRLGTDLLETASTAFTDGLHVAAVVGMVFALGAALLAYRLMRHLPAAAPDETRAENEAAPEAVTV
ncbi:DHA2 family multidrug resistance protein-like MFS transporter [Streptomyces sp. 1114.5]|uniref:MFS transporter n=1 Tax=Streptomyces sp. 1114.5 TaxID=1938830 RepID=UPI000EAE6E26|nr:MFS transporter [Streptomyces sp. 1114.5]RKT17141.1 DHA2 family multidrug resistance protein-like MFS transporter [Streptomyces sp. 1114.5]